MKHERGEANTSKYLPFLTSFALNTIILIIALCFSHMQFGSNDDRDISNLLANVSGQQNGYYITFVNVIFSKVMSCIFKWTDNIINWYVLMCVIFSFLALICISELVIRRASNYWVGLCLSVILVTWIYKSHYIVFQFTQNAALYSLTGVLLLGDMVLYKWEKHSWRTCVIGILFLLLGSLVRFQSIYFTGPYICLIVGYEALTHERKEVFFSWLRQKWKPLAAISLGVVLVLSVRYVHIKTFEYNQELNDYYIDNNLRAELLDYGVPDYQQHADEFSALGITEDDLWLFSKHTCIDKEVYNRQTLEAMVSMKGTKGTTYSPENLRLSSIPAIWNSVTESPSSIVLWGLIFADLLFFVVCTDRKHFLLILGSIFLPIGMMWYFVSVNRMPYRVWYSIVVPALVMITYICAMGYRPTSEEGCKGFRVGSAEKALHVFGIVLLVTATLTMMAITIRRACLDDSKDITDSYEKILDFAQEHPDTLVLLDRPTVTPLTYCSTITPMTCLARGSHQNICYQGGWICWTPGNMCVLQNFGIDNPYRAIGEGMEVYLIDSVSPGRKLAFIRSHYNERVAMEQMGTIEGTDIGIFRLFIPEQ